MYAPIVTRAYQAEYAFHTAHRQAKRNALLGALTGRAWQLREFPAILQGLPRRRLGMQTMQISEISGSVGRTADFDRRFLPLNKDLVRPWKQALLNGSSDHLAPVRVIRVDGEYYLDDGHVRLSAARFEGIEFVEAEVWEVVRESAPQTAPGAGLQAVKAPACCCMPTSVQGVRCS